MNEFLVPIIKTRYVRHAAILIERANTQELVAFCDTYNWQHANNYFRMPYAAVDCKRCRARSWKGMSYHLMKYGIDSQRISVELFDEHEIAAKDALRSGDRNRKLILADWLDEQGDPRAELIRVVVELSCRGYDENNPLRRVFLLNRALEMKRDFLGIAGG